jgi:hypothetical protein
MSVLIVAAEPSAWEFGWEALVAIGTLGLAGATAVLAWKTRGLAEETAKEVEHSGRQVEESQRQVQVSQEQARTAQEALRAAHEQTRLAQLSLSAQIRPVLVDVPLDLTQEEYVRYADRPEPVTGHRGEVHVADASDGVTISVPFRNAGAGMAIVRGVSLDVGEAMPTPPVTLVPANVAAGQHGRISFLAGPDHAGLDGIRAALTPEGGFSVELGYSDLTGENYTIARFDVFYRSEAEPNWGVRQVHWRKPPDDEPYAGSAPVF